MSSIAAKDYQDGFFCRNPGLRQPLQLMKAVPDASFFVKDTHYRYVMVNDFHLAIYGLAREEDLVGKAASDFFPDLLAQAYQANDRRVLESRESLWNEVWLVPRVHGLPRWFLSNKSPLFDLQGDVMGLAGLMYVIATPEHQRTHFQELERVVEFLERSFVDEISVPRLAEIAGISVAHLNRRFRQLLRLSPMEYVHSLRMHEAKRLLATTDQNLGQIAAAAGFYDQSYFTKRFRKATGMTPLAYRKHFRKNHGTD
ncbi:MAG: AraC family transcriptional regulator [Pirellulaceae bacterium]|jgi:PAS domain S-box-containing protein|nr:AraC family transcriptional regulator [Pirellulaceae bacterium]